MLAFARSHGVAVTVSDMVSVLAAARVEVAPPQAAVVMVRSPAPMNAAVLRMMSPSVPLSVSPWFPLVVPLPGRAQPVVQRSELAGHCTYLAAHSPHRRTLSSG